MIIKKQKQIEFINDCDCLVDYIELAKAIIWYQDKPSCSKKHIYLHAKYPCVSIHDKKVHIHRLLMMYWKKNSIPKGKVVHHLNHDKLDARKENLVISDLKEHQSYHNKDKVISEKQRQRIIDFNYTRKGIPKPKRRKDISYKLVNNLFNQGLSVNKIAIQLKCDWSCIKQRLKDIHDNPELLEVE